MLAAALQSLIHENLANNDQAVMGFQSSRSDITVGAYSGMFRMPTPDVVSEGRLSIGMSTGTVVKQVVAQPVNPKSLNYFGVVGILPSVEVGLSFLTPSLFNGLIQDRSVSVKWAPFIEPRNPFSLAVGTTDIQGTDRRKIDYGVLGKNLGSFHLYGGYGHGLDGGFMAGATKDLTSCVSLEIERSGPTEMAGLKAIVAKRIAMAAALNQHGGLFAGVNYSIPLKSPELRESRNIDSKDLLKGLAKRLASNGHGAAEVSEEEGELIVKYDDVDARDPVRTLGHAIRLCVDSASPTTNELVLTVRRFGFDLVTVSGPVQDIRQFINGWQTEADFSKAVSIEDGGGTSDPDSPCSPKSFGTNPKALITLGSVFNYRLGQTDEFPNRELVVVDSLARLPSQLLLAATTSLPLHNTYDHSSGFASPTLALYRTDRLDQGLWTMVGIDRNQYEPWSGNAQFAYCAPWFPIQLSGSVSRPFEKTPAKGETRFFAQASLDLMSGTASAFVRRERFLAGDVGNTYGFIRKFGQTWLTLEAISTHDNANRVQRYGFTFDFPLPGASVDSGPVRLTTANTSPFTYLATPHAEPSLGLGVPRSNLLSPMQNLTARGQLTASFIRQQLKRLCQ